jgi:hypothetical protein
LFNAWEKTTFFLKFLVALLYCHAKPEDKYPRDERPRRAILACRDWAETGTFHMAKIHKASLDAHAAAKTAAEEDAKYAAAAGQAVATAYVPTRTLGALIYDIRAVAAHSGMWMTALLRSAGGNCKGSPSKSKKGILPNKNSILSGKLVGRAGFEPATARYLWPRQARMKPTMGRPLQLLHPPSTSADSRALPG